MYGEHKAFVENERLAFSRSAWRSGSTLVRRAAAADFFADVSSPVVGLSLRRNSCSHAEHVLSPAFLVREVPRDGRWRTTS